MQRLFNFYKLLNILSLDVALGSVCCAAWFAKFFHVNLRPYALICLGMTVWIIYTTDHLMDVVKIKTTASTSRHRFHQHYFTQLTYVAVLAVLIDFVFLFFIRDEVFYAGLFLSGIVGAYLLLNRWLGFLKELVVATLYCGGVLLPVLSLRSELYTFPDILLIAAFFLTAFINVILFAWYDYESDKRDGYNSFALKFGPRFAKALLTALFVVQGIVIGLLYAFGDFLSSSLFVAMNAALYLLFKKPTDFSQEDNYRLLGDAVFLFPVVFLIIG